MKRILKSPAVQWFLSLLMSLWLRFVYATCSKHVEMHENARPYMSGERQAIFCFWHGRMILNPFKKPPKRNMRVLISHHRDGALITAILKWFGIGTVRGSSRKGGDAAIRELLTAIENGDNISITPDGPKGPAFIAQHGAAYVAQRTQLPLIPVSFGASRAKQFRSWDKFLLPTPFAKIVYVIGTPIHVSENDVVETASTTLSDMMNDVMREADRLAA